MRVLSFNEPYISFNVQNLIYASNAFDLDEQIENILKEMMSNKVDRVEAING